jgi:hypothetical protein
MSEHVVKAGSRSRERDQGLASRIAAVDILFRVNRVPTSCSARVCPTLRRLIGA